MPITTQEAARELGVSPRRVRALISQGKIEQTGRGLVAKRSVSRIAAGVRIAGRPASHSDVLARMLLGKGTKGCPPRTVARIKNMIRNEDAHALAKYLQKTRNRELAALSQRALASGLDSRRALKHLKEIQLEWIEKNPQKNGHRMPVALTGLQSSAQIARIVRSHNRDMALRIISDHIRDLQSADSEQVRTLIFEPSQTNSIELNALLAAGAAWAAARHNLQQPEWATKVRAPKLLWGESRTENNEKDWIPEFRARNIYATPEFFSKSVPAI